MAWMDEILKKGKNDITEVRRRLDSWANALTGLNTSRDKTTSTVPVLDQILSLFTLEALYHNSDIAARIVTAIVEEAFRERWTIECDDPDAEEASDEIKSQKSDLEADFKRLMVKKKLKETMIWGRLYGMSGALLGVDDGVSDQKEPLDDENVRNIRFITVLDRRDLTPYSWYGDLEEEKFGDIAQFIVQPVGVYMGTSINGISSNPPVLVHETRLLKFGGELTSKREKQRNAGFDYSVLQKCFRALQLTDNNWQSASMLLADAGQGVFKIKGLIDMIAQQPDVMNQRMQLVDMMRSTVRAIILDAGDGKNGPAEDFDRIATPFQGIPEMLVQTWNRLACAARMPLMVLMGSKPAGLNTQGEEDLEWWYNSIEAEQREKIQPAAERVLRLCATARGFANADRWTIKFGQLRRATAKDQADIDLKRMQRDEIAINTQVWTPVEVALSRDADPSGMTTKIDVDARKALAQKALEVHAAEADGKIKVAKAPIAPIAPPKAPNGAPSGSKA